METVDRKAVRLMRRSLSDMKQADKKISHQIIALLDEEKPSAVLGFSSVAGEPCLAEVYQYCFAKEIPLGFPVCDVQTETMVFREVRGITDLHPGAYGILEPRAELSVILPDERAVCLVPGLLFDLRGGRIGNGKGYYDKYLSVYSIWKIGVCYACFLREKLPQAPWDVQMDSIICEERI